MKSVVAVLLFALCSPLLFAQTAKVIKLSPEETATALQLVAEQKELDAKLMALEKRRMVLYNSIAKKYLIIAAPKGSPGVDSTCVVGWVSKERATKYYREGWDCGDFEYSDDYQYIVPEPHIYWSGGYSLTPCKGTYASDEDCFTGSPVKPVVPATTPDCLTCMPVAQKQ